MSPTRREVLAGLGGATLAYGLQIACAPGEQATGIDFEPEDDAPAPRPGGRPDEPGVDARDWLFISGAGSVTAFTARTEIGQGLTTVLYNLLEQAFELPRERVNVVMGDTDTCPNDGPTTGSAATGFVAWAFWMASHQIKQDLVALAAEASATATTDLEYRAGEIVNRHDAAAPPIGIGELVDGQVRRISVEPDSTAVPPYVDRGTLNANGEAIVTGTLQYTADLYPEDVVYGAMVAPEYHRAETRLRIAHVREARELPGVVRVRELGGEIYALGETYTAARRAAETVDAKWMVPERPADLDTEAEVRGGARLRRLVEERGDVGRGLDDSAIVVRETYTTQYATQVPLETDTALARREEGRVRVDLGTQNPFWVRHRVAEREGVSPDEVRIVTHPAGGAFGSKANHSVGFEAARMLQLTDRPVKYVYSRKDDVQKRGRYKEAVVIDISSGLTAEGRLLARDIDIYQDEGHGTLEVYEVPHVRTRLYTTPLPPRHATMRGTSYAQDVFAVESHTDMVALKAGVDPLEFRRQHVELPAFVPLIDSAAAMLGYGERQAPTDHGIGFGICNHGDRQLGVVGAEVRVDRQSGRIAVLRLAGAYDIGLLINRNLAANGIKSAMIWGLGYALLEEVRLDGHRCHTTGFADYRIARMSDTPPIELAFFDNQAPGRPRGCGEMPLPATVAAIANAVYAAIGVRLYTLPMTPERVLTALPG